MLNNLIILFMIGIIYESLCIYKNRETIKNNNRKIDELLIELSPT